MNSSRCMGCEAPIVWAKLESGKAMPLDLKVTVVYQQVDGVWQQVRGRQPHWGACKARDEFKAAKEEST